MAFLRSVLLVVLLVTGVLVGRLPHPCLGDGAGQACSATRCGCVATCSCQQAHMRARAAQRHRACGNAALLACHDVGEGHAFLPDRPDPAVTGSRGPTPALATEPERGAAQALAPPVAPRPPRPRPPWVAQA